MNKTSFASTVAMLTLLSACGGGDDMVVPVADAVPASALASAQAFSAYAGSAPPDDRAEPLGLDSVEPPTSETDEPVEVG